MTRTHNHLGHKQTLNHLAKLGKRLRCVVSTYLYGAFDCIFLSCHDAFQSESWLCCLKRIHEMIRTYSQMHCIDRCSQHSSIIWSVWLNGWVFVYEISVCGWIDELFCICVMVDWRNAISLLSSQDDCQRSSPLRISNTLRAGFRPPQNLSSGLVEWSCAVVITTTPRRHKSSCSHLEYLVF